jgi:hypothetical protein
MQRATLAPRKGLLQCMRWIDYIRRVNASGCQADTGIPAISDHEAGSLGADADGWLISDATRRGTKKCGPGQTRRLTGTAGARDL